MDTKCCPSEAGFHSLTAHKLNVECQARCGHVVPSSFYCKQALSEPCKKEGLSAGEAGQAGQAALFIPGDHLWPNIG